MSWWPGRLGDIWLHRRRGHLMLLLLGGPGQVWPEVANPVPLLTATPAAAKPLMPSPASRPVIPFGPLPSLYISVDN